MKLSERSLSDLILLKSILEERLSKRKAWVDSQRGYSYKEYYERQAVYANDEDHKRLKK